MTLRALVTRPEEDAAPLAAALAERGIDVTLEPLLAIRPLPEAPIDLAGVQALLFTSANGVRSFAELAGGRDLAGWRELPVFAVGNATAAAANGGLGGPPRPPPARGRAPTPPAGEGRRGGAPPREGGGEGPSIRGGALF